MAKAKAASEAVPPVDQQWRLVVNGVRKLTVVAVKQRLAGGTGWLAYVGSSDVQVGDVWFSPGAQKMLREFGVEVGGGPAPWAGAERELDAAVASGRIRCYGHHSFNVGGHFYVVDRGSKYDQYECSGATREVAAAGAAAWLANCPTPQPDPAGMSDQAVRDELWTLGWRLVDGRRWTRGDQVLPGSEALISSYNRRVLVEARRRAAEAKAGGQG